MKRCIVLIFLALSLPSFAQLRGKIVKVSDGDTVTLLDSLNTQHRVRLEGIDCPEKGQAYGNRATEFTKNFCAGKYAVVDVFGYDIYKRILGVVYIDGGNLNEALLKAGLAWRYKYSKNPHYLQLQEEAKTKKAGLWRDSNPIDPASFRKQKSNAKSNR